MLKKLLVIIMFISLFACEKSYGTQKDDIDKLFNAKSIKIYWDKGVTTNWAKGSPNIKKEKWSSEREKSFVIFDSINMKKGTARINALDVSSVTVISRADGIHFIEETLSGNLSVVTVFPYIDKDKSGKYIAVMSRHMNFSNGPFPSQWYGTAEILK